MILESINAVLAVVCMGACFYAGKAVSERTATEVALRKVLNENAALREKNEQLERCNEYMKSLCQENVHD